MTHTATHTPEPPAAVLAAGAANNQTPAEVMAEFLALEREPWFPRIVDPEFFEFARARGRVPALGDDPAPFTYRGWLLWQVWLMSCHESVAPRWPFYFRLLAAGRLLDEPIPRLDLVEPAVQKKNPHGQLGKLVEKLGRELGYGERALNALVEWLAFALAVDFDGTPPDLPESVQSMLYREFDPSPLLVTPQDVLGSMLEEFRGKGTAKRASGFFLTSPTLCEFMTQAAAADASGDLRTYETYEPACGSSRQLLAASNYSLALAGQDIDRECVLISRVNAALFCPWLAWPLPVSLLGARPADAGLFETPATELAAAPPDLTPAPAPNLAPTAGREDEAGPAGVAARPPTREQEGGPPRPSPQAKRAPKRGAEQESQPSLFD